MERSRKNSRIGVSAATVDGAPLSAIGGFLPVLLAWLGFRGPFI